jgi:hypothetical protein
VVDFESDFPALSHYREMFPVFAQLLSGGLGQLRQLVLLGSDEVDPFD